MRLVWLMLEDEALQGRDEFRDIIDCLDVRMSAANLPGLQFIEDEIEDVVRAATLPENLAAATGSALLQFAGENESLILN